MENRRTKVPSWELAEYRLAWMSIPAGAIAAIVVLLCSGMVLLAQPMLEYAAIIGALLVGHYVYAHHRPSKRLELITGSVALMILAALLGGIVANAGLRLKFPFTDDILLAADQKMGIDTPWIVMTIAGWRRVGSVLGYAYQSIFPLSFASALWLAWNGQARRLWELVLGFSAGVQMAAIISVAVPATGNIFHAGLAHLSGTGLPAGSGTYYLHAMMSYRDGTDPTLDATKLEGVVTFPSFHIIMAIIVGYAFRSSGPVRWPIYMWCSLVAISTIPIGGHYVIDLIGGAGLWAATMLSARVMPVSLALPFTGLQTSKSASREITGVPTA